MGADRTKKVKEARDEAKKEVDAYRKEKDDEFKKFESEVGFSIKSGSSSSLFNASLAHKWQQES